VGSIADPDASREDAHVGLAWPDTDLTDGVVRLRAWSEDDLATVETASADPRIPETTTVPAVYTRPEGEAFVRRQRARTAAGEGWSFAVADARDDEAVGCGVLLLRPQPGVAGIGYWLLPAARGRGLATRAVGLLTDWGLAAAGVVRVEAWVVPGDVASIGVLTRCGFRHEGRLRSFLLLGSHRTDALVFARLASDDPGRGWPTWAREPIAVVAPDPAWPRAARALADDVAARLGSRGIGPIQHVGSTAVPGLPAKPVLDLQAPMRSLDDAEAVQATLATAGWQPVPPDLDDRAWRRLYVLPDGAHRRAHLSLVDPSHPRAREVVRFRDLLRARPELARIYAEVKQLAAEVHEHDREAYTAAKTGVIRGLLDAGRTS
jgi:[ribosomal protein S5]-alanine N-acetyltransferase